jgi:hypothetical protein
MFSFHVNRHIACPQFQERFHIPLRTVDSAQRQVRGNGMDRRGIDPEHKVRIVAIRIVRLFQLLRIGFAVEVAVMIAVKIDEAPSRSEYAQPFRIG